MGKGLSFLSEPNKTARGEIRHLNVVITEPDNEKSVLVVPICTYREKNGKPFPGQDPSCLLPAGCHPFVKTRSFVNYGKAQSMTFANIFNGLKKGKLIAKEDFDARFVQDMQRGAEESLFLPEKLKRFFEYFISN